VAKIEPEEASVLLRGYRLRKFGPIGNEEIYKLATE